MRLSAKPLFRRFFSRLMPKGLYARALIIIIAPMVLLQSIIAYAFMERHWQLVTRRLSSAVAADVAALIDIHETFSQDQEEVISRIASERLGLDVTFLDPGPLPAAVPKAFFSILEETLAEELSKQVGRAFWLDTVSKPNQIEIRLQLGPSIMRVYARRSLAYASNSHIFLVWMAGSSVVLLSLAIVILRNQIRPILKLAEAAESFGKGQEIEFRPRGAREVRQAGHAFIEMKRRIERAIEQRTAMLNGVSHDLRTLLTRFTLSLALMKPDEEVNDLKKDVAEMTLMLESYLAFARGEDMSEQSALMDLRPLLEELRIDCERSGKVFDSEIVGDPQIRVKPTLFRRALLNLAANAGRYGQHIQIRAVHEARWLSVCIDDDGPGIAPEQREEVFKPFVRLDEARNQDEGGSGLGLSIARDGIRAHGGDVVLQESPLGGLRVLLRLPA